MKKELEKKVNELEILSTFVHGSLFFGHSLGVLYNLRKRNYKDTFVHVLAGAYDLFSTISHYRKIKNE